MKKIKKFSFVLCSAMMIVAPTFATAVPNEIVSVTANQPYILEGVEVEYQGDILEEKGVKSTIFNGGAELKTSGYSFIESGENWLWKTITVTNKAGNAGAILIEILDGKGNHIMQTSTGIKPGTSKEYYIPAAWNGEYEINGKAVSSDGTYQIYITD